MEDKFIDIYFEELKASNKLPSPSGVALEIIRLTQNPEHKIDDLLRPVQSDPILTGRLLKLANSAMNSSTTPVISAKEALLRVGSQALTHLALSLSILDSNRIGSCHAFDYDGFWVSSLLRALSMQLFVKSDSLLKPEEAFSVGLLSEIGRLALAQIHPVRYAQCLLTKDRNLLDLEREVFLITHDQISVQMMREWGIPEKVLAAVLMSFQAGYDELETGNEQTVLAAQLRLSTLLAGERGIDQGFHNLPWLLDFLSIDFLLLDQLRSKLFVEWCSWGKLLCMPIRDDYEIWLDGYRNNSETNSDANLKVLVVEDDRTERHILTQYLSWQGYKVFAAENGNQALKEYILHRPHVVITDYLMESMDGLTLTRALRSNRETQNVYIILVTADKDAKMMSTAFDAGVNDFIIKPARSEELNARIIGAKRFLKLQQDNQNEKDFVRNTAVDSALSKRKLATLAITDPLTGLFNRRYANSRLEQEWAFYTRHKRAFGIISLDLDFFKQVNDSYGHEVGDKVLQHFSGILQKTIRSEEIPCRMGGEEFIVICPNIDASMIEILCERIRNMVEKNQPNELNLSRLITVSVGAAVTDLNLDPTPFDTLRRSDRALYLAKQKGRNNTIVFTGIEEH